MQGNGPRESNDERQEARVCRCHTRRRLQKIWPASAPVLLRYLCNRIAICRTTLVMYHPRCHESSSGCARCGVQGRVCGASARACCATHRLTVAARQRGRAHGVIATGGDAMNNINNFFPPAQKLMRASGECMGRKVMPRPACHMCETAPVTGGGGVS